MEMIIGKTFEEWKKEGYWIKKGSKAIGFKDGKALFSRDQVDVSYMSMMDQEYQSEIMPFDHH